MSDPNIPPYPGQPEPTGAGGTPPPPPYGATPYPAAPYAGGYGTGYGAGYGAGYVGAYAGPVPYAHWGLRLAGYLLDSIVLIPFYVVAAVAGALAEDPDTGETNGAALALTLVAYLAVIVFAVWNQILRQGRTGQSLGKQWVDIRLVREDTGQPLGGGLTFGRALLHVLDALPCYLGFLWPLWDAKRQTFADKIVGSVVVRTSVAAGATPSWPQQPPY